MLQWKLQLLPLLALMLLNLMEKDCWGLGRWDGQTATLSVSDKDCYSLLSQ